MKYEDLKGKSLDEINKLILEGKKELFNLRFQRTTGELDKTHRFNQIRKEIARAKTFLNSSAAKDAPKASKETKKAAKAEPKAKATKTKKAKKVA
jgi:large subunit ribosomal protein L29